ncbi:Leucine-rich repeat domain containing protein [Parasponia andersonii]|uniref:Leucine-rich repeat domain containing protein n=1 Tax=Parasponia andersonii TaxID=3476 RepID=A0A2P5AZY3_PARAD|nr:Leucine-rich repeat domain containing protein [Parasponia andersonii]
MSRSAPQIAVSLFVHLVYLTGILGSNLGVGEPKIRCKEAERQALLKIKAELNVFGQKYKILESWGKEEETRECCEWIGVRCDNKSDHVITVDLSPSTFDRNDYTPLQGNISSSFAYLQYLTYLDLSTISFFLQPIPSFIGTLTKLRYLNLSHTGMSGEIPQQLGKLSSLETLDLHHNFLETSSLKWASNLSSLQLLDLSLTTMKAADDWVHVVNNLPSLTYLKLSECDLPDIVPPFTSLVNSSKLLAVLDLSVNPTLSASIFPWLFNYNRRSLVHLDLSWCELKGSIPRSFGINMTSITHLDLSNNNLERSIPEAFGNMTSLEYLDLGHNMLEGEIPKSILKICTLRSLLARENNLAGEFPELIKSSLSKCPHFSLEYLDLSQNKIMGSLPNNFTLIPSLKELKLSSNQFSSNLSETIGQLSQLEILDLSGNSIEGVMSEAHFAKLFNLRYLDLSSNSRLVLSLRSDWVPHFQLDYIYLGSCKLGPHFPTWLQTQKNYLELNISGSEISDSAPSSFWNLPVSLRSLDLSNNEIKGTIPKNKQALDLNAQVDLSSNQLEGSVPSFLLRVTALSLFRNRFSDLNSVCQNTTNDYLIFLDVSYNQLSGELPDCWSNMSSLRILILSNNELTGKLPVSIGFLDRIQTMHFDNNNLTGELPSSLTNCKDLMVFDVGENGFTGPIPSWLGKNVTNLVILSLRSNDFYGSMPPQLCHFQDLQVLDLSSNNLSGSIPTCLGNITAMKEIGSSVSNIKHLYDFRAFPGFLILKYNDRLSVLWKGAVNELQNLGLLKNIDLSSNKLTGEIPREITKLIGLVSLNLSRNNLSGQIPGDIGHLRSLDALDLSKNQLFGQIPSSVSQMDRLSTLDLSSNNLSGKIPTGTQLQTRDAAAYAGNPELCGAPLPKKCLDEEEPTMSPPTKDGEEQEYEDNFITKGFYVSIALGFVVGFWGVGGSLIFKKSWRHAYFKLLNNAWEWAYVTSTVYKAKLLRMIKN